MDERKIYLIINLVLAGIFGLIFLYSAFYNTLKDKNKVQCYYQKKYGTPCPTCGISRDFSMIIKGDIVMNKNSLQLFGFFSFQLFMRIGLGIYLCKVKNCSIAKVLAFDVMVSTFLLTVAVHNIVYELHRRG